MEATSFVFMYNKNQLNIIKVLYLCKVKREIGVIPMRSRHCMCEFFQFAPLKISGRHEKANGARARRPAFIENTLQPTRIGWWILYAYFLCKFDPLIFL
ncbi:hypothetical protein AN161_22155 [Lysinibacillus sp. FJAT-14222]|nr:hypothetical protein AN161_22155 [Lysinibacillus sp. FJAT-14222]